MQDLTALFNNLKLLYFEYDKYQNKFIRDKNCEKSDCYKEFIKLTYELSKNQIQFFIDENNDLVISSKDSVIEHLKQRVKNINYSIKNRNKNIYILSDKSVKYAKNLPLINTKPILDEVDLSNYDAIIFTSKNGVIHLNSISKQWKDIPAYAISTQTAKELKKFGVKPAFVGKEKHGNEFANELINLLVNKKVAYVGAKTIVSNLIDILNDNKIICHHIAVYETVCTQYEEKIDLPDDSIIIFSSPSTIKCFMKNVNWKDSFRAVSIGKTTLKYFPDFIKPSVADNTTLESCVQKALNLQE